MLSNTCINSTVVLIVWHVAGRVVAYQVRVSAARGCHSRGPARSRWPPLPLAVAGGLAGAAPAPAPAAMARLPLLDVLLPKELEELLLRHAASLVRVRRLSWHLARTGTPPGLCRTSGGLSAAASWRRIRSLRYEEFKKGS